MRFRHHLYSLFAAASIAWSSPAEAQERYERECAHVFGPESQSDEIPENPFEHIPPNPYADERPDIPPNPFCTQEDLERWREDADAHLDSRLLLRDPSENFPRWQRSSGMTSHRLELPDQVHLNLGGERLEFGQFSIGDHETEWLWRGHDLRTYIRRFDEDDITIHGHSTTYTLQDLLTAAQRDIPTLVPRMTDLLSEFWMDVRSIFGDGDPRLGAEFSIFFRGLLPGYTDDGVITPDEAQEIYEQARQKIELAYERELTDAEREALDEAIDEFTQGTNALFDMLMIDDLLEPILHDPLGSIFFGQHTLEGYVQLGEDILSLLDVHIEDNALDARLDVHGRLAGQSDYASTYFFHTADGDYFLRHGLLNSTNLLSEGHLRINAEFHGGRPLSDFTELVDQETLDAIAQIELLLGYRPVTIDATLQASLTARVFLENLLRDAYEITLIRGDHHVGLGIAHGFVHRFGLDLGSSAAASIDSFAYRIDAHFNFDLLMQEESGRQVLMYQFLEGRQDPVWYGLSFGLLWEHLLVRRYEQHIRFDLVSDFEGNEEHAFSDERIDATSMEQRLVPILSGTVGIDIGPLGLFVTFQDGTVGTGVYLATPHVTMEARMDDAGHIRLEGIGALAGRIETGQARRFHRDRILQEHSLFPARRAVVWNMTSQYRAGAMHGLFLESRVDLSVGDDPHQAPIVTRAGIMFAGDAYIRLGVQGSPDFQVYGAYAGGGMDAFGMTAALLQESIAGRDSTATSIAVQASLNLDELRLHLGATGMMVSPQMARFLTYGQEKFGYTYTLAIEGIL